MHAHTIVAYDVDGARYCLNCCREEGIDTTQDKPDSGYGGPVFESDLESGETCSGCGDYITEPEPVQCLCGKPVSEDSHWFDDRVSGVKFCSQSCAEKYRDKNENGEEIP